MRLFCKHKYTKIFERCMDDMHVSQYNSFVKVVYPKRIVGYKCEKCEDVCIESFYENDYYS